MARSTPPTRMADLAAAARRTFIETGYKRTQVADVARAAGLSPAALYRHVESKDALFHLAFLEVAPDADAFVATPAPGATVELIAQRLRRAAFPRATATAAVPDDPAAELRAIIAGQYRAVADNWELLALIEASARDRVDIAEQYFERGRRELTRDLARYLARRVAQGCFRAVGDPQLVALQIRESCAWFAWHRRSDPDTAPIDDDAALVSLTDVYVRALVGP